MPAVASMVELVEMEGDALALAGNWVLVGKWCSTRRRLPGHEQSSTYEAGSLPAVPNTLY